MGLVRDGELNFSCRNKGMGLSHGDVEMGGLRVMNAGEFIRLVIGKVYRRGMGISDG